MAYLIDNRINIRNVSNFYRLGDENNQLSIKCQKFGIETSHSNALRLTNQSVGTIGRSANVQGRFHKVDELTEEGDPTQKGCEKIGNNNRKWREF